MARSIIYLRYIFIYFLFFVSSNYTNVLAVQIGDDPLETVVMAAPANIMFILDDSGSMDWEFMTQEPNGVFDPNNTNNWAESHFYVFDGNDYIPEDDHTYNESDYPNRCLDYEGKRRWKSQWYGYNRIFYNPFMEYKPWPGVSYGNADTKKPRSNPIDSSITFDLTKTFLELNEEDDHGDTYNEATPISCNTNVDGILEDAGDHDFFKIELTSSGTLTVRTSGCTDTEGRILDDSGNTYRFNDYTGLLDNPYADDCCNNAQNIFCNANPHCDMSCSSFQDLGFYISLDNVPAGIYYIEVIGWEQSTTGSYTLNVSYTGTCMEPSTNHTPHLINIKNAHYFVVDDVDGDNEHDQGESIYLVNFKSLEPVEREFYEFIDLNSDGKIALNELSLLDNNIPAFLTTRTPEEDLQNFANWFSYYRKRELTAKAAISMALTALSEVNVGLYSINNRLNQHVLYIDDNRDALLDNLFSLDSYSGTPLRQALLAVGRYFDADDGTTGGIGEAPWALEEDGGACQQAFAILMTDGYWNGESPNVGNVDGDDGIPFADNYENTLADVARKFYEDDLSDSLSNMVPINACDQNNKQHLVTYSISFGLEGELEPGYKSYHPCMLDVINNEPGAPPPPQWPDPTTNCNSCARKIDDLWHAAINGRGAYYSAGNPEQLIQALSAIIENIKARTSSGAAVSVNTEELNTGTILYQTSYDSLNWTGNIKAFSLNPSTGEISEPLWEGQQKLLDQDWDSGRRIITSDGSAGKVFRFDDLTDTQKNYLGSDETTQKNVINFIRGKEVQGMRVRPKENDKVMKLGDLVHSAPVLVNETVYVGGNDGMLHAFNAQTGEERFAFIPNHLFPKLFLLTLEPYDHQYYVDLTSTVRPHVDLTNSTDQTVLVGGLGAGGKGYFALNITQADTITNASLESDVKSMFLWEYPSSGTDSDLGVSLSKVSIVKTHSSIVPYVAIFGNGYNSDNGHAVLYILNLATGDVVRKLDTQVGNDNGLSTPAVVDVDGDFIADYVYAGDLKGNLWKFDISSSNISEWKVAFGDASTPKPLFQAEGQPITTRPDIMRHCLKHGYMVIFGTGKFLSNADLVDTSTQSVYGIWDYGDPDLSSEYVGSFNPDTEDFTPSDELNGNNVQLLAQTILTGTQVVQGSEYRTFSNNVANWSTEDEADGIHMSDPKGTVTAPAHVGWYVNLGGSGFEGERLGRDVIIRNGKAILITIIPDDSLCSGGGSSVLYEVDACDGSRLESPVFDVDKDDLLTADDTVPISGGGSAFPSGLVFDVMLQSPIFLRIPPSLTSSNLQEFKYFSTSQGTILRIREPADFTGINYWIEW